MTLFRIGHLGLAVALLASACGAAGSSGSSIQAGRASSIPIPDTGVSLAQNSGGTLIVVSVDPGEPGDNTLQVDLRDATGTSVTASIRVDLTLDGAAGASATIRAGAKGALTVARAGKAELQVTVVDGKSAGATVTFGLDLPVLRIPQDTLGEIDRAMEGLHTLREAQTLSGGGPAEVFHFDYQAPDRVRYTVVGATGKIDEARLIGRDRFDSEAGGPWTHSDLGFPSRVPYSAYAPSASRVRVIGHERDGAVDVTEVAFVQTREVYYRLWFGTQDHLARRYTMMTKGHYMTGTFSDFDAPLSIAAP